MNTPQQRTSGSKAAKNTAVISILKTFGFVSTILIDITVAARFGFSQETDAFFLAFTIPKLIMSILLVSMNAVLVPIFTRVMMKDGADKLWRVVSNLTNINLLALGGVGLLGVVLSPLLMRLFGIALDNETQALAVSLSAVLFLMVIPAGAIEVMAAALNSLRSFGAPEATILLRNLATLTVLLLLGSRYGIYAVAIGYSVAAFLQLAALGLILVVTKRLRYHLSLDFSEDNTRFAVTQMRYPLAGAVFGQGSIVVERFLASFLPTGSISLLAYARRLYAALDSMFAGSVSVAFLPRLSAQFSRENLENFRNSVTLALKMTLFITAPVAAGVIVLSSPTVELLYGRGEVDQASLDTIALLLSVYALAIPLMAVYRIIRMAYYSFNDTKTPFRNRMVMLGLNIVIDVALLPFLGVVSLAIGFVTSLFIMTVYMFWQLRREIGGYGPDLTVYAAKIGLAAILMASMVLIANSLIAWQGHLSLSVRLAPAIVVGAITYPLVLILLRVKEVKRIASSITARGSVS
jgi:putative peptidoglycan lipid II flippase